MRILVAVLVLFIGLFPKIGNASPAQDFYIQQALDRYFTLPGDARSLSTSGSSDLTCQGSICTFLNPAGLGFQSVVESSITLATGRVNGDEFIRDESIEQTENRGNIILAIPLGDVEHGNPRYGTLSLAFSRYQGKTNDSINTTPDGHRRTLAYSYAPSKDFSLGYTFTFYDDQLHSDLADLHSHARILHQLGTQLALDDDTMLGATLKIGTGQSDTEDYIKQSDGLSRPHEVSLGVGVQRNYGAFTPSVSADFNHVKSEGDLDNITSSKVVIGSNEEGDFFNIRAGTEYLATEHIALRGGIRWYEVTSYEFQRSDLSELSGRVRGIGWSAGIGYNFNPTAEASRGIRLDYGFDYLSASDGQWEHRISLTIPYA